MNPRAVFVTALALMVLLSGLTGVAAAAHDPKDPDHDLINPNVPDSGEHFPDSTFDEHFPDSTFDERFPGLEWFPGSDWFPGSEWQEDEGPELSG